MIYTSVHAAIIDQLHETDKVIGVCEPRYMDTPAIQEGIQAGRIADLGEATSPNIEKMIEIGAELVIASPFQNSSYGPVEKIGIPIIEGADYMEAFPLGRTEWIHCGSPRCVCYPQGSYFLSLLFSAFGAPFCSSGRILIL